MKDKQIFQLHADICQALTHLIRLEIINDLRIGEKKRRPTGSSAASASGNRLPAPQHHASSCRAVKERASTTGWAAPESAPPMMKCTSLPWGIFPLRLNCLPIKSKQFWRI